MTDHYLSITYRPKVAPVYEGKIRQTIRKGQRFKVGDSVIFHGWQGQPYRSKWTDTSPRFRLLQILNILLYREGIHFQGFRGIQGSSNIIPWAHLDSLAVLDGITPPTGVELGKVLLPGEKTHLEGIPAQILRW